MRKLLFLLLAFPIIALAQSQQPVTGNLVAAASACNQPPTTSTPNCILLNLSGNTSGAGVTLSNTFVATVQFEGSGDDGNTWVALNMTPTNSTTAATSATAPGTWRANVSGLTGIRVRVSAYTSGTVTASIQPANASAGSIGSGGGGGGSGCVPAGSAGQILEDSGSGTCLDSLATDNGTTFAYTGTGGFVGPKALLGTDGSVAGTVQLSNSAAAFHTIVSSAATANNTVSFFATAPTTGDLVDCVTASTTCTLTDSGVLAANVITDTGTATSNVLMKGAGSKAIQTSSVTDNGTNVSTAEPFVSGTDGTMAGSFQAANGSANAHTIFGSAATTSNTINGFATAPTTGDLVDCVTATTVCTLTDTGVLASQVVTSAASLTSNAVVLGAGSQGTKVSTGITTNGASELDLGLNGTASGVLGFNGSTSGKATLTAPAVAGTSTNAVVSSNVLQLPAGAAATTAIQFANTANTGIYGDATHMFHVIGGGVDYAVQGNGNFILDNNTFGWTPNVTTTGADVGISRTANGVLAIGTGAQGSTAGQLKTAAYMSVGTTFTSNAGCTEGTLVGGATAGKFTVGQATACTIIITMGNSATAPNGWACAAYDQTAVPAVAIRQTASTTTTASLLMTVATNDVVTFHCIGY